jgi:hypothetical protein
MWPDFVLQTILRSRPTLFRLHHFRSALGGCWVGDFSVSLAMPGVRAALGRQSFEEWEQGVRVFEEDLSLGAIFQQRTSDDLPSSLAEMLIFEAFRFLAQFGEVPTIHEAWAAALGV